MDEQLNVLIHTLAGYDCAHIGTFEPVDLLQIASDLRALRPVLTQDRHLVLRNPAVVHQVSEYAHLRTIHIHIYERYVIILVEFCVNWCVSAV